MKHYASLLEVIIPIEIAVDALLRNAYNAAAAHRDAVLEYAITLDEMRFLDFCWRVMVYLDEEELKELAVWLRQAFAKNGTSPQPPHWGSIFMP